MTTRVNLTVTNPKLHVSVAIGGDGRYETIDGVERTKWNDYSLYIIQENRTPGQNSSHIGDQWWDCSVFAPSQFNANSILTLQSRLSEAVKGHQFNLAVSAAEGKKTVSMVSNAIMSIGGAILDLKRGRFESAARRFGVSQRPSALSKKDVAGRWLELQYGWLPLLKDVHEASKAYEELTKPPRRDRVSVSINSTSIADTSTSPPNFSCKGQVKERIRIIYEMSEQLSEARSLGLTDPLTVAWELIPYSFVVDWFLPVGSYLENLNTIPHLSGRFLTTETRRFQGSAAVVDKTVNWSNKPITHHSQFVMSRKVSSGLAVPKPVFNTLPEAMSPKRIWNAIALVTQRLR